MIDKKLEKYIEDHTSNEDPVIYKVNRATNLRTTLPRMLSGKIQGKFLEMVSKMIAPERILEIGTFTGYSALCLSKGLKKGGRLITIESNPELEEMILGFFKDAGADNSIELKIGNALNIIPMLKESFDLVFLDADKREYMDYYELILPNVKKGGIIIADNVLWSGKVIDENPDDETRALQKFNDHVARDQRVEQVMLSIRDGLLMIRKI